MSDQTLPNRKVSPAKVLPRWNIVLVDDDDHTYDYVIEMLINLFGQDLAGGFQLARRIDRDGRAIVFTTHRELAELKIEQISGFGTDPRISRCVGPMSARLEPVD